ncbi:MAG: hypothetical protein C4320_06940, partial [Armatimonadota bacterium]
MRHRYPLTVELQPGSGSVKGTVGVDESGKG